MRKFANFSSSPFVKGRLQAALYHAKKNRLKRIQDSIPEPEPEEPEDPEEE